MSSLHERAKELFFAALDLPPADRTAFLGRAFGHDSVLKDEVESLLAFHTEEEARSADSGPVSPGTGRDPFAPGAMFAGRYRMVALLGQGGMAEVWRADDVVLDTPVALKLIHSASPEGRGRILNEVRLARQITHPAVCRVFDVGEAEGEVFFSMELVRGEDLAALLKRVGRFPSEKVIEIGRQLCSGLAAAHAQGVLHRDLKPANVLVDENGLVRITDFGIAITRSDAGHHTLIGTPAYMAPEQLVAGIPLSERTDLYALGLVLYELVTGQHPFRGSSLVSEPRRPSALVPDVSPLLERVVLQAISPDPRDRPASAAAMAESLSAVAGPGDSDRLRGSSLGSQRRNRWFTGAALATVVGGLAIGAALVFQPGADALTAQDTILLADFVNATGEPVFDGALKVGLAVALEQSPFLKVFPDGRIRETLRLMQRSPEARVTPSLAREIAQRERLKALVVGSITSLGHNYVLALEALNARTGDVMAREQIEVTGKEQVLTALGDATSRLREKLGESLTSIQQFDVPLPKATTSSLEALEAYALALDDGRMTARLEAIPHLKRAIELDPDFALAHALLSGVYANLGQSALAPSLSRRAFELRDRVSERERFFISWRYYRDATQAWEKGLELAQSWAATYPRDENAFNSVGLAASSLGQYERAVEALREASRLDSKAGNPRVNLASALLALNRFDEATTVLQQAEVAHVESVESHRLSYVLAFVEGDQAAMTRHLDAALKMQEGVGAANWEARASAFVGRVQVAHDQFGRGIQTALQRGFTELAAQWTMEDAESHAVVGQCAEARDHVSAGLVSSRDNFTLERASRVLALCGAGNESARLADELAQRFPDATLTMRIALPLSGAALAVERGESARALELLEGVRAYDRAPASGFWPAYLRGQAHLQLKNGPEAAVQFQSILDHRGENADSSLYPVAALGLARAERMAGEPGKARRAYEDFLTFWKNADLNLQPLIDARREVALLN